LASTRVSAHGLALLIDILTLASEDYDVSAARERKER
jgi:hypothetical protein